MKVHMSLSSGLCAKEQFPTYWHLRPFWAWIQSCRWARESLLSPTGLCHCVGHFKVFQGLPSPISAHVILLWEVSNGWKRPHRHPFPLGLGHHQKDPPLLGPARSEMRVIGKSQRGGLGVCTPSFLSQSTGLPSLGPSLTVLWQCPILPMSLPRACSPMPGLGTAVLEVLVWLHHLPIPPALTTHKLHLQVKGAGPMCPWGTLLEDRVGW